MYTEISKEDQAKLFKKRKQQFDDALSKIDEHLAFLKLDYKHSLPDLKKEEDCKAKEKELQESLKHFIQIKNSQFEVQEKFQEVFEGIFHKISSIENKRDQAAALSFLAIHMFKLTPLPPKISSVDARFSSPPDIDSEKDDDPVLTKKYVMTANDILNYNGWVKKIKLLRAQIWDVFVQDKNIQATLLDFAKKISCKDFTFSYYAFFDLIFYLRKEFPLFNQALIRAGLPNDDKNLISFRALNQSREGYVELTNSAEQALKVQEYFNDFLPISTLSEESPLQNIKTKVIAQIDALPRPLPRPFSMFFNGLSQPYNQLKQNIEKANTPQAILNAIQVTIKATSQKDNEKFHLSDLELLEAGLILFYNKNNIPLTLEIELQVVSSSVFASASASK